MEALWYKSIDGVRNEEAKSKLKVWFDVCILQKEIIQAYYTSARGGPLMFHPPILRGKSEAYEVFENDGDTHAKGTKFNFFFCLPLIDYHFEYWNFWQGDYYSALVWHCELTLRNEDNKDVRLGGSSFSVGWPEKPIRINYINNSTNLTLSAQDFTKTVKLIDEIRETNLRILAFERIISDNSNCQRRA
jgi:hypothetical protein